LLSFQYEFGTKLDGGVLALVLLRTPLFANQYLRYVLVSDAMKAKLVKAETTLRMRTSLKPVRHPPGLGREHRRRQ
jgi:hypothetical protein